MDYYDNGSPQRKHMSQNTGGYGNGSFTGNGSFSSAGRSSNAVYSDSNTPPAAAPHRNETPQGGSGAPGKRVSYTDYGAYASNANGKSDPPHQNGSNTAPQQRTAPSAGTGAHYSRIAKKGNPANGAGTNGGSGKNGGGKPPNKPPVSGGGSHGNGNGRTPKKPQSFFQQFKKKLISWLKRLLRAIYMMDKTLRIFLFSAAGFVLVCVIVIAAVSGSRHKRAEEMAALLAMATPVPTIAASATPVPTPSPTPEIRIEKGQEGEDVMALQKRLMELGYLAIDEPTSYFGHATKEAVKLFQRQHELQQDGICGNDTILLIYSEEAKPYVMTEGAEGNDIESFQDQLVELGYLESNQVTGYYGSDTVSAVKKFQHRNHLGEDGKAGEKTLESINSPDARVSYTKEQEIIAEKKKQAALARAQSPAGAHRQDDLHREETDRRFVYPRQERAGFVRLFRTRLLLPASGQRVYAPAQRGGAEPDLKLDKGLGFGRCEARRSFILQVGRQ